MANENDSAKQGTVEPGSKKFTVSRTFNAPVKTVFKVFTEEKHLAKWWGPKGFDWVSSKLDLRPGGMFLYCMKSPEGFEMWGKFVYHEISPFDKIVFVNSFSDKDGNTTRAPFNQDWPLEVRNVLTLKEEDGKTVLTLSGGPINCTEKERETFESNFDNMQKGFTGTFDQLEEYLVKL